MPSSVLAHQPNAKVVIPHHKMAVPSLTGDTQRDQHIKVIAEIGRFSLNSDLFNNDV